MCVCMCIYIYKIVMSYGIMFTQLVLSRVGSPGRLQCSESSLDSGLVRTS